MIVEVSISAGKSLLNGILTLPVNPKGLILFAHGSGSGRFSSRNQFVAKKMQDAGFATLLMDLLTEQEDAIDQATRQFRFDIELLAQRVIDTTKWVQKHDDCSSLKIGYFGASTGAACALVAAAYFGDAIAAVVSRGGRPDLAGAVLPQVKAPTLLIVGGNDLSVIKLNQQAFKALTCEKVIETIEGATHLFEEQGALEEVSRLALQWFTKYIYNKPSKIK